MKERVSLSVRSTIDAADRLIVAIDVPPGGSSTDRPIEVDDALNVVRTLGDDVRFYKVGWPLYLSEGGQDVPRILLEMGKRVFLDLKFGDTPHAVGKLVAKVARQGIDFLTLNASPEAIAAASDARDSAGGSLQLLSVTLLTSLDETYLENLGSALTVPEYVTQSALRAKGARCDGIICSGRDASGIREAVGPDFLIVTPGIRPQSAGHDDHQRVSTPAGAVNAGADYLVVGRPIVRSTDPAGAARRILDEMQQAFAQVEA